MSERASVREREGGRGREAGRERERERGREVEVGGEREGQEDGSEFSGIAGVEGLGSQSRGALYQQIQSRGSVVTCYSDRGYNRAHRLKSGAEKVKSRGATSHLVTQSLSKRLVSVTKHICDL